MTRAFTAGLSLAATSAIVAALALNAPAQASSGDQVVLDTTGTVGAGVGATAASTPAAGQVVVDPVTGVATTVAPAAGSAAPAASSGGSVAPAGSGSSTPVPTISAPVAAPVTSPPTTVAAPATTIAPAPRPTTPPTTARSRAS